MDPTQPQTDSQRIEAKLDNLRAYLEATLNGATVNGVYQPGVMPRLTAVETRVTALEQGRNWTKEKIATVCLSILSAVGSAWAVTHTR